MRRRTLIGLGAAAAASIGAAVVLTPREAATPDPDDARLAFPGLAERLAGATRIELRRAGATMTLARRDPETWTLPEKDDYPVRSERIRELLVGLTELRLVERRTASPELFARLGVDDPEDKDSTAILVRVLDAAGVPIAQVIAGHRRVRTQGGVPESIYLRFPGQNQTWLAEGRLPVDTDPQLWIDRDIANLPRDRVLRVLVSRGEAPLELRRGDAPDSPLRVVVPAEATGLDENAVNDVAGAFEFLTFGDVLPEAKLQADPVGESRFTLTDNLGIAVRVGLNQGNVWIRLTATGDSEAVRLNSRWRGWAYQVGAWKEKALVPRIEDLRREAPTPPPPGQTEQPGVLPPAPPASP
ncbi:DUF4340 domain-containing protein [Roseomonas gilardii]|uniref:DUF4340 domain-containing protein n=1 Tax=Roseomonas gilardii TaxID=257708 RepID=A0ABU3MKY2_9PROT|nr:DUF4340 domain-containing protein [Roseomonas gilardii]MDT8333375.1 DUF4340 domain-containing protein [Roseomonas gilardii]